VVVFGGTWVGVIVHAATSARRTTATRTFTGRFYFRVAAGRNYFGICGGVCAFREA
jgi:hypothetical protein